MSRFPGPKLPKQLLEQVTDGRIGKRNHQQARKDRRKQERTQKKLARAEPRDRNATRTREYQVTPAVKAPPRVLEPKVVPQKPVRKQKEQSPAREQTPESEESEGEEEVSEDSDDEDNDYARAPVVSKAVKAKLDEDDDEIARLEKKLGIKKGRKKVGDDELDWLVGGGGSSDEDGAATPGKKKRAAPEDDDWLKQKRLKASHSATQVQKVDADTELACDEDVEDSASELLPNPFSDDEISEGDFEGFEEDDEDEDGDEEAEAEAQVPVTKKRENPYVAPVAPSAAKYVPPSLRKGTTSDEETLKKLRRQMQGNLNRLSETNIISILASIQEIYAKNARQHCTTVLVELFRERVADPSDPGDNALILFAGFATALYRVIGTDFAAQLLESLVHEFDRSQREAAEGKQMMNILSFLSNLYVLQTIGCEIVFEYVKLLLGDFTEANTVLLLRIVRIAGQQLRQDDPSALKDIVLLLNRNVTAAGGVEKLSQRTRVMIDFIHDLKNNRVKANRGPDATAQDHMQRMKKTLSTIKNAKTSEPLRIGLADIRDAEKKGKWWLVGASWKDPAKMANGGNASTKQAGTEPSNSIADGPHESDDPEAGVDLNALAKAQGMNTDVRKAIFVSVAGAVDPQHAQLRLLKLNLKNKQMLEIPRVIIHCVGAEPVYNHFYTLVGLKFCSDRRMKKAWQFALLDVLRRCGEDSAVEEDDDRPADELSVRQVYNIAKLYATLISEGLLRISILKPMRFATLQPKSQIFAEVLITTLFVLLRKRAGKEKFGSSVEQAFGDAHYVQGLVKGLAYFVETVMPGSEVPTKKEKKVVDAGCEYASSALHDETKQSKAMSGADGDDSDVEGSIEVDWD
ncbi:transcription factor HOG pathway [Pseudocercospora fijiensis CIRAD86]|uniref:Transcription factor HOG pathway n=1 Tax=Pseudocercospora fijiensis (strain CIRAD86) TaxID=383855 RepID=M2ZPB7_PSEFD|nr:transcription factor HOG pathway [Pseudocercospora fijiensis CIRAD86]EME80944.1 transcription factor HOG pathway [Pseudocercospora fijiensis CIRAD86]